MLHKWLSSEPLAMAVPPTRDVDSNCALARAASLLLVADVTSRPHSLAPLPAARSCLADTERAVHILIILGLASNPTALPRLP